MVEYFIKKFKVERFGEHDGRHSMGSAIGRPNWIYTFFSSEIDDIQFQSWVFVPSTLTSERRSSARTSFQSNRGQLILSKWLRCNWALGSVRNSNLSTLPSAERSIEPIWIWKEIGGLVAFGASHPHGIVGHLPKWGESPLMGGRLLRRDSQPSQIRQCNASFAEDNRRQSWTTRRQRRAADDKSNDPTDPFSTSFSPLENDLSSTDTRPTRSSNLRWNQRSQIDHPHPQTIKFEKNQSKSLTTYRPDSY